MDTIVKGIDEGLLLILPDGEWTEVQHSLLDKIESQSNFYQGATAFVDVTERDLRIADITDLRDQLDRFGMHMKGLLSLSERTRNNAQTLGLLTAIPDKRPRSNGRTRITTALPSTDDTAFLLMKNVRSGVRIEKKESIVIIGDVNPGAELISDGDVVIWGKIKGKITAGAKGDEKAVVRALSLGESQISIAGIREVFPKKTRKQDPDRPLVLKIKNGEITMENTKH